ncbi:MAG: YihY family inner membrane protein [Gammaproteobacteria bacterium]|nr:YihY family inner membrane protein [Gammaproteobacteria bacterium]NNC77964.1 YihY family inner membrane protein [Woeseiaceae bacterium]
MYNAPMIKEFRQKLEDFIWADMISKRGTPGRIVATILRYLYAVLRDVFSGQLTLRAMSLVYTTLLSIVPLLAFSFSVLKGLGVHQDLPARLSGLLQPLGEKGVEYTNKLISVVESVNGKALAGIGLAFFLYTVISMVQKTEESFNYVWYVSKPRSLARRLAEYLSVLLVGPLFIAIAIGMIGVLTSGSLYDYVVNNSFFGPIVETLGSLVPYIIVCSVFTFMYMFMPNTKVNLSAALVGGIAGGILWATTSVLFAAVVVDSTKNNAIYAGLAIPISALIWLYLNWLILLVGSQLAFYFQNPAYLRVGRRDPQLSNSMRERLALNIMLAVGQEFRHPSGGINIDALSSQLKVPGLTLSPIVSGLEKAGLLTVTEKEKLQPGREMTRISLAEILRVVRVIGETGSYRGPKWSPQIASLGEQLDGAIENIVGEKSLAELLDELEPA